jgi:hypothetical protein
MKKHDGSLAHRVYRKKIHIDYLHVDQSESIIFTVEKEKKDCLIFLDVLTMKKHDGSLAHRVYRKKTHIDYLHDESHYHPAQKTRIINMLMIHAIRISQKDHLEQEFNNLMRVLLNNEYKTKDIRKGRSMKSFKRLGETKLRLGT